MSGKNKITLEIQYFKSCPHSAEFIENVKEAIRRSNPDKFEYREIIVDTNEKAGEIKFRGSPTLLINGIDLEDAEAPENPGLACRNYPNGLPDADKIKTRLDLIKG